MKNNILQEKSYAFAIRIVQTYKILKSDHREFILSKQLLRSGTSIGANIEEAIGGQSKVDFIHKLSISYKEAMETSYWLKLLRDTEYLSKEIADSLILDVKEICRIIAKILITLKSRSI